MIGYPPIKGCEIVLMVMSVTVLELVLLTTVKSSVVDGEVVGVRVFVGVTVGVGVLVEVTALVGVGVGVPTHGFEPPLTISPADPT